MPNPTPGIYRHYKGNLYKVIAMARHSETLEDMVVYRALDGEGGTWVRPASMWDDLIEVDGETVRRFEHAGESERVDKHSELAQAHDALLSTLRKCEAIDLNKQGKAQQTLLVRRIAALKLALELIEKEQNIP